MKRQRKKYQVQKRQEQKLKRKNFLPTLLITIFLWLILGGFIYFVDPGVFGVILIFFFLAFFALLFTISLAFASGRRGLVGASAIILFLFLSYLGIGNYLNLILIIAIAICIELYFSAR